MARKFYDIGNNRQYSDVEDVCEGKGWDFYVWGEVQNVHKIGDYAVIEYIVNRGEDAGETRFHPALWTDQYKQHHGNLFYWQDTNTSYMTLEEAVIGVIAYKYDGLNSQAARYFYKMIGLGKE